MKTRIFSLAMVVVLCAALIPSTPVSAADTNSDYTTISSSLQHVMIIKENGDLYGFGENAAGQVGNPGAEYSGTLHAWRPTFSPEFVLSDAVSVSAGLGHTAVIKSDDSLWTFGNNVCGERGDGKYGLPTDFVIKEGEEQVYFETEHFSMPIDEFYKPVKVMENVKSVSAGNTFTLAVKKDNTLWAWGRNQNGQLGNGKAGYGQEEHLPFKVMDGVESAYAAETFSYITMLDGTIWEIGNRLKPNLEEQSDGTWIDTNQGKCSPPRKIFDSVLEIHDGLVLMPDRSLYNLSDFTDGWIEKPVAIMNDVYVFTRPG